MEATTLKQLQTIVNNARDISDAQLTVLFLKYQIKASNPQS
ncbi:MAG: hypothetical protein WC599_10945 [Bacteroidales bacterium]